MTIGWLFSLEFHLRARVEWWQTESWTKSNPLVVLNACAGDASSASSSGGSARRSETETETGAISFLTLFETKRLIYTMVPNLLSYRKLQCLDKEKEFFISKY